MSDAIMWWNYVNSEGGVASDAALRLGGRGWGAPRQRRDRMQFWCGIAVAACRVRVWLWPCHHQTTRKTRLSG